MLIGIVGLPGSGKSIFCDMLGDCGGIVIDADGIGHDLYADSDIRARLIESFGQDILTRNQLDRTALARKATMDNLSIDRLNAIMHPPLLERLAIAIRESWRISPDRPVIVDAALLTEWGIGCYFDALIYIWASAEERYRRLDLMRIDTDRIRRLESFQLNEKEKRSICHLIVENNGTLDELQKKANVLYGLIAGKPFGAEGEMRECQKKLWIN